eukprot:PhM_4_TR5218/c0_g1_i6/m.103760
MIEIASLFSVTEWLPRCTLQSIRADFLAGIIVLVMSVPQVAAYAHLANLDAVVGFYSCTVPAVVYALCGHSRELSVGPVAMLSMLTGQAILESGIDPYTSEAAHFALTLAFVSGCLGLIVAALRLGHLTTYLNHCVVSGFTAGGAITIALSQLGRCFDLSTPHADNAVSMLYGVIEAIVEHHASSSVWIVMCMSVASCAFLLVGRRYMPMWFPLHLALLVTATLVSYYGHLEDSLGLSVMGVLPSQLPPPSAPFVPSPRPTVSLMTFAALITLVGYMEAYSIALRFAAKTGYTLDPNKELVSLSLANVLSSLFSGMPTTGSFSRTALNSDVGCRSQAAGLVPAAGMLVVLTVLNAHDVFYHVPRFTMSCIVITAVVKLVDYRDALRYYALDRVDFTVWMTSCVATLCLGVDIGLGVGIVVSLLSVTYRTTRRTWHAAVVEEDAENAVLPRPHIGGTHHIQQQRRRRVFVFQFHGSVYFTNIDVFARALQDSVREQLAAVEASAAASATLAAADPNDAPNTNTTGDGDGDGDVPVVSSPPSAAAALADVTATASSYECVFDEVRLDMSAVCDLDAVAAVQFGKIVMRGLHLGGLDTYRAPVVLVNTPHKAKDSLVRAGVTGHDIVFGRCLSHSDIAVILSRASALSDSSRVFGGGVLAVSTRFQVEPLGADLVAYDGSSVGLPSVRSRSVSQEPSSWRSCPTEETRLLHKR